MSYNKIGFIGSGKMAGAIIKGLIKTEAGESPEEYMRRQINQMEIDENDEVVYVPVQMMQ